MEKLFPSLRSRLGLWKIRFDYYREALFEYYFHKLNGGNAKSRINGFLQSKYIGRNCDPLTHEKIALFVAFHPGKAVPQSNLAYINALASCGFRIIYIHNGPLQENDIDILSHTCEQIHCRLNIGQDMGAWKDGLEYLEVNAMLAEVKWLLLCNDSNLFIGGEQEMAFKELFGRELQSEKLDLICLNRNFQAWMHCQSFFLCFNKNLFSSEKFKKFWREYLPLSHRHHAIANGEIKLSNDVIKNSRISVLYDSVALFREIEIGSPKAREVFPLMPLGALYLSSGNSLNKPIDPVRLQCIFASLDSRNPSHVYALLFIKFLNSPFIKKDLVLQGVFCLTQLTSLMESVGIEYGSDQWLEFINALTRSGSNISYINYRKEAFRKGIYSDGLGVIKGEGKHLAGLGVSSLL